MKIASQLITKMSGSIGGITGSHNKGGLYFRARAVPTNPGSSFQQAVRNAVAQLTSRWTDTLTQAQRDAWAVYAANVPLVDTLGESRTVPPLSMYVRSNVPRLQASLAVVDNGPTTYTLATMTDPSVGIDATADEVDVSYTNTDPWAITTGGALLVLCSRPQGVGINYFKGPYRLAGTILGDTSTPPTSPTSLSLPFVAAVGQTIFVQIRATNADGRLSAPFRLSGVGA